MQSRREYLQKREAEKLEDLDAEIADEEYLFSSDQMTEREHKELEYKRTLRDLAKDYKKAGAKEQQERKNRYFMPEEKRSKVRRSRWSLERIYLSLSLISFSHSLAPVRTRP